MVTAGITDVIYDFHLHLAILSGRGWAVGDGRRGVSTHSPAIK